MKSISNYKPSFVFVVVISFENVINMLTQIISSVNRETVTTKGAARQASNDFNYCSLIVTSNQRALT